VSDLGEFNSSGSFDIFNASVQVASLSLKFLHEGVPRLALSAQWTPPIEAPSPILVTTNSEQVLESFKKLGHPVLLGLLSRPNIASKEWMIRQYDHEAQGTSVIKPLHTTASGTARAWSGPNDASVIKPKPTSDFGLAVGCGIHPRLSDVDPFLMAQAAVDEAVRNVLCVGAEYGSPESVLALLDNFCWSDPIHNVEKMGALVRACQGLQDAALALATPLISGKDSMKNEYQGKRRGELVSISVPPTLLITAVARVTDIKQARTADFKSVGDFIYLIGNSQLGLQGSELQAMVGETEQIHPVSAELQLLGLSPSRDRGRAK
jgi:phosphoribosylformylglycinamidine synthase